MKKNSRLYIWIASDLKEQIRKQSEESGLSINEICLEKLKQNSPLQSMKNKIDFIYQKLNMEGNMEKPDSEDEEEQNQEEGYIDLN